MSSSVIRSYAYDEEARRLDVLFVSGLRYSYVDVPKHVMAGLGAALSKGRYFNAHIRDRYPSHRQRSVSERRTPLGD